MSHGVRDFLETFAPMLRNLDAVLGKGAEYARSKSFDADVLANARLAPDMFTLAQQVQLACHHARDAVVRLSGGEPSRAQNAGISFDECRAHVRRTLDALAAVPAAAFEGAEARSVVIAPPGADFVFAMSGLEFLRDWALPHFYFHVVTAYDILRHNGVDIGKRDYAAGAGKYIRKAP